jgi:hypothetical protein
MNNELESICKEVAMVRSRHYPGICWRDWVKPRKVVKIADVPADIRKEHLPKASLLGS